MMAENIIARIFTTVIYGVVLFGCMMPMVFIVRTKHNITKFGYKKYIFVIAGVEVLLLLSAVLVLFLLTIPFYNSIIWNKTGINMEFFIMLYQLMLKYIVPVYMLVIAVAGVYVKLKEGHSHSE